MLPRPHRFSFEEDATIRKLFDVCSTEKLSILMNLDAKTIVQRYQFLTNYDEYQKRLNSIEKPVRVCRKSSSK
jgi:hypothetical protein